MELRCEFGLRFVILAFATSRFRGNDKAVFLVYRQEPHGPGPSSLLKIDMFRFD